MYAIRSYYVFISAKDAGEKTFRASRSADLAFHTDLTNGAPIIDVDHIINLDDEVTPPNQDVNNNWNGTRFVASLVGHYRSYNFV